MTTLLFRDDAYRREADAIVVASDGARGLILDRTPFYALGGGQPGDSGVLRTADGRTFPVTTARYGPDKTVVIHDLDGEAALPALGTALTAAIDWDKRLRRMRIHTALHLLTAVLPYPVTGGSIGDGDGRLDFDVPDAGLDRADIEARLNGLIARDAAVHSRWISDDELLANPGLVKTMSVKPPMGTGRIRLVEIVGIDLQPCGGTHVANTGEIGRATITAIEKKGKQNRRIRLSLAPSA